MPRRGSRVQISSPAPFHSSAADDGRSGQGWFGATLLQVEAALPRRGTQVVRERSAKPLCVGSIPTRASNPFNNLEPSRSRDQRVTAAGIVAGGYRSLAESPTARLYASAVEPHHSHRIESLQMLQRPRLTLLGTRYKIQLPIRNEYASRTKQRRPHEVLRTPTHRTKTKASDGWGTRSFIRPWVGNAGERLKLA